MDHLSIQNTEKNIHTVLASQKSLLEKQESIRVYILNLLTTRSSYTKLIDGGRQNLSDLSTRYKQQMDWYRRQQSIWENLPQGDGNPGWIQLNCYEKEKPKNGVNIKIYRTIPIDEYAFIQHLKPLMRELTSLSEHTDDYISFKFPRGLLGFMKHADSLVVHFQKKENIDRIQGIIDTWMNQNKITHVNREGNRTELAVDHQGMSFSELIALDIAYQIIVHPTQVSSLIQDGINISKKPNFILA